MRLSCQACGAAISLDAAIGHEGASEAVKIALQLPSPLGKLLIQYVGMFRPAKRQLTMDRLASLLGDLLQMIDEGKIERGGRTYSAPLTYWQQAIEDMLAKREQLTLPLKSHGYLLTIIAGYAEKADAAAEKAAEDRKRSGAPPKESGNKTTVKNMPEHIRAQLQEFVKKGGSKNGNQA
jgi:hypothetical protein